MGRLGAATLFVLAASVAIVWLVNAPRSGGTPGGGTGPPPELGPPPETDRPLAFTSSVQCRECHEEVFAEWEGSHHAIAYTNPEVQKLSKNFRDRECLPCHSSRPIFETGLGNLRQPELGSRPLEREVRIEEGVDCFTCHQFKNAMLGSPSRLTGTSPAPCNPLPYAGIHDLGLCSPCHDQHKVIQDWLETEFASGPTKKDCADCHMPPAPRKGTRGRAAYVGRSHRFPAAHDPEFLKKAASMTTSADGQRRLLVTVKNDGTGHNVPSDERHRAVDLVVTFRDKSGNAVSAQVDRYRNPYRDEFHLKNPLRSPGAERDYQVAFGAFGAADVHVKRVPAAYRPDRKVFHPESTQIPAGEARSYVIKPPEGASAATVRLIYKLNPYVKDEDGTLLHEQSIDLP
jgi:hypothetical protein